MTNSFTITTATGKINLNEERRGKAVFTVTNTTETPVGGRANIVVDNPVAEDWVSVEGDIEREFAPNATEQVVVNIDATTGAPIGTYGVSLQMIGVENPDEDFTQGPSVTFDVVDEPEPEPKKFPWWIVALVVGVLVLAVIIFFVVRAFREPDDFSFFDAASEARWFARGFGEIEFDNFSNSSNGFVGHRDNVLLEDRKTYTTLVMDPPRRGGTSVGSFISGEFRVPEIREGQRFRAQIGRVPPRQIGRAQPISVSIRVNNTPVFEVDKPTSGSLLDINVDLSAVAGEDATVLIEIFRRGFQDSGQGENAIHWINPRITSGN